MIGDIADKTPGADKADINRAVGMDSRVGSKCMAWGYGFGGPCFPRDNKALALHTQTVNIDTSLLLAIDLSNKSHARTMAMDLIKDLKDTVSRSVITEMLNKST